MNQLNLERVFVGSSIAAKARCLLLQEVGEAYLVGGGVRDAILGREGRDLDFVVDASALTLGRRLADALGGSYYALDPQRGFARIVVAGEGERRVFLDISALDDASLQEDLTARDFTMNAMAMRLSDGWIFDPFRGQSDLAQGLLRVVSERAIADDPIRALRAVRLVVEFGLTMEPETGRFVREDGRGLASASQERLRDELVRILMLPTAAPALDAFAQLDLLPWILPELEPMRGCGQSLPHRLDVWEHSLLTVSRLECLLAGILALDGEPSVAGPQESLDEVRTELRQHLVTPVSDQRPRWVILKLAAILHDVGKPCRSQIDASGRTRFFGHEEPGAMTAESVARRLRLSSAEIRLVRTVVGRHMWPINLAGEAQLSLRAAHRYHRELGSAGIDVALLALADAWALEPGPSTSETCSRVARTVGSLLRHALSADGAETAPSLLSGTDVMRLSGLSPGRQVGHWLRELREAQIAGQFHDRAGAARWLREAMTAGDDNIQWSEGEGQAQ